MNFKRGLVTMGLACVMGANTTMVFAAPAVGINQEQRAKVVAGTSEVRYSDFLIDGEVWVDLNLQGATFTETDPNAIRDAISTNYAVDTTLALRQDGTGIEFGVYEARQGISYKDEWVITIDQSVLSVDYDLTTTIRVRDNVSAMPKVVADRTTLTRNELQNGTTITLNIQGARFNTACTGQYIRQSIMTTSNIGIYVVPFCDYTDNTIKLYIKALNGIPSHETKLDFKLTRQATSAYNDLPVTIYFAK